MAAPGIASGLKRALALRLVRKALQMLDALSWLLARVEKLLAGADFEMGVRPAVAPQYPAVNPVLAVEIAFEFDGSATVSIDGSEEFHLSTNLAALLAILVDDSGTSNDSIVGWKTFKEIRLRLDEKYGKKMPSKHALQNGMYQLRNELERRGFSRRLIQCVRGLGCRFALRRASAVKPEISPGDTAGLSGIEEDPL